MNFCLTNLNCLNSNNLSCNVTHDPNATPNKQIVGWLSDLARRIIWPEALMNYKVVVNESEEGFSVSCPGLPGCWSQGQTESEALENIQDAIREYLAAIDDLVKGQDVREVSVAV